MGFLEAHYDAQVGLVIMQVRQGTCRCRLAMDLFICVSLFESDKCLGSRPNEFKLN